jgi:hypothetical protein
MPTTREEEKMSITIKGVTKQDTAYDKRITFEREGVEYSVLLHWDSYDGFDLNFLDGRGFTTTPEWAIEWYEVEGEGESLEYSLDALTDQVIEASYL